MKRNASVLVIAIILASVCNAEAATDEQLEQFFAAARAGELDKIKNLLEAGVPIDATDKYGATALIMASGSPHLEVVEFLLDKGADPNLQETFYGADSLGMALFRGTPEVAIVLLQNGADDRAMAFGAAATRQDNEELARAAVAAGPFYESSLEELRAADLQEKYRKLLADVESRPDPALPTYTASDLEPFTGYF